MPRSDGQDPTAAARQARRRARLQAQAERDDATLGHVLAAVLELSRKVDNLARAVDSRDVTRPSVTSRPSPRPRARGETAPQAPTGPMGRYDVTTSRPDGELVASVLDVLQGHGANSAGAIHDALGHQGQRATLGEVAAALVQLLGGGHVIREPGATSLQPDRWRAIPGALQLLEVDAHLVQVKPGPDLHVSCEDYAAHQLTHAWDPASQAFVCGTCHPAPVAIAQ